MRVDITWLKPGTRMNQVSDEDEESWSAVPSETLISGCILWPEESDEDPQPDRPHHAKTVLMVLVPYGTPIKPGHRVRIETGPYAGPDPLEVIGLPHHWSYPWEQWEPGAVVRLMEVQG